MQIIKDMNIDNW